MASPIGTADVRTSLPPPNVQLTASRLPKQATVEDYFSDTPEQQNEARSLRDNPTERRRNSIIRDASIPKRTAISWSDEPRFPTLGPEQHQSMKSQASRASRLSEAQTAVSSNVDSYDREANSVGRKKRQQREHRVSSTSESEYDDVRYNRYAVRRSANRPRPTSYNHKGHTTTDHLKDDGSDQRTRFPTTSFYPGHEPMCPSGGSQASKHAVTRTPYSPLLDPSFFNPTNPFGPPGTVSQIPRAAYVGDPVHNFNYYNSMSPWNYGRYPPFYPPPPLNSSPPPETTGKSQRIPHEEEALLSTHERQLSKSKALFGPNEADKTERYDDFMRNLQQTLEKYKVATEKVEELPLAKTTPNVSLRPSAASLQPEDHISDLDLIKLMEERVLALKLKNEKKLLEANQVLAYLSRGYGEEQPQSDDEATSTERIGVADANVEMTDVHKFRTPEHETDYDSDSDSDSTSIDDSIDDSIAGDSSGSSVSFLRPPPPQVNLARRTAESEQIQGGPRARIEQPENGSTDSCNSDDESTVSGSESSRLTSRLTSPIIENETSGASVGVLAQPVPEHQEEDQVMDELVSLRRDLSILKRQMTRKNKAWLSHTLSSAITGWKKHFRAPPRPGMQRLEWICECGDEMYADLPVKNSSQNQQMLEFLTRPGPKTKQADQRQATPSQLEGGTAQPGHTSLQSSQSSFVRSTTPASTFGSSSTYVGSGSSQFPAAQQTDPCARNKYLELCVNVGKYETKLAEIQVSSSQSSGAGICTDAHLFRQIYHRYCALRKHTWRRFLYRPAGIKFVHFGVQAGYRVSFFSSDPLPSDDAIATKRYEYSLQPPVLPPMDSRTFLHYFYKHNTHSHSTSAKYVNRLPKKLGESLTRSLGVDDLLEGWGIHIIEGPNKVALCWALMIVLTASLGVSIGYDLITKSGDSGFAIGQWMVAALTVALSALYFSLEDEVNASFD